jgi:hypothetical protein
VPISLEHDGALAIKQVCQVPCNDMIRKTSTNKGIMVTAEI